MFSSGTYFDLKNGLALSFSGCLISLWKPTNALLISVIDSDVLIYSNSFCVIISKSFCFMHPLQRVLFIYGTKYLSKYCSLPLIPILEYILRGLKLLLLAFLDDILLLLIYPQVLIPNHKIRL